MTAVLLVVHVTVGALWFGAMTYSLFVVQPRLARIAGEDRVEDAQRELAHGNRWPVVSMIALLWLTGIGLVLLSDGGGRWWWIGVAVKAVLLAAASALFWWISWRAWPRRVFALPAELPSLQRRFRQVAIAMLALVATAFITGLAIR